MAMVRFLVFASFFVLVAGETARAQLTGPDLPDSLSVQGLLSDTNGVAVPDGNYDLLFKLYKGPTVVWQQNLVAVPVSNGVFNVVLGGVGTASLDSVAFNVPLDLGVTVNGGAELSPRTPLTGTPYALAVRGLYAVDAQNGEGMAPNLIGGASNNTVAAGIVGATIGGGGGVIAAESEGNVVAGSWATVSGGSGNEAGGGQSTVGGGAGNSASGATSTIGGGSGNEAAAPGSTIAGGANNLASGQNSFVGGGIGNQATGLGAVVGGGEYNVASGGDASVPGGGTNAARGDDSFAAGYRARANHNLSFVWNGYTSLDSLWTTAPQQFIIGAPGGVGINTNTPDAELAVYDANNNDDSFLRFRTTSPAKNMVVGLSSGDVGMVSVESNHPLIFRTNQNERIRIKTDGTVGIGTSVVAAQLDVRSNSIFPTIHAENASGGLALQITGNVDVSGSISKSSGNFKIDHPLDPKNKYLYHSFVESPDMMNVYNGNVVLDGGGTATVELPAYFEALNRDFRYQLTAIGAPGPNLYISRKIEDNTFEIAGGEPGMEVSWMVTGIRQDPFAVQHPIQVEVDKPANERGTYLHPEAYLAAR